MMLMAVFLPFSAIYIAPYLTQTTPKKTKMLMAGFLPFSAIYIELYYVFASVWGHQAHVLKSPTR